MPVAPQRSAGLPPSARAQQVMDLRCEGLSYRAIERRLGIGRSTVGVYVQMVCEYLGTHDPHAARRLWRARQARPAMGQFDAPCEFVGGGRC